jgi:hypothetical protein
MSFTTPARTDPAAAAGDAGKHTAAAAGDAGKHAAEAGSPGSREGMPVGTAQALARLLLFAELGRTAPGGLGPDLLPSKLGAA